jgi:hypothetical protein
MSDALDAQLQKALDYMAAGIVQDSYNNNTTPFEMVREAIIRGMEYQKNLDNIDKPEPKEDKEWMYAQRNCNELGADYFAYQGYHPPKDPPRDEQGYPYYGITH